MSASFLSYIVQQHGLTFEDVATDALAHILRNSLNERSVFRTFLNAQVQDVLPELFSIETRVDTQGCGVPDVVFTDVTDRPCVIIEAKFTAGLTQHQPSGYLSYLRSKLVPNRLAMLMFLVPESRISHYKEHVRRRCPDEDVDCDGQSTGETKLYVRFVTWDACLKVLRRAQVQECEFGVFLDDLERMCSLAEPDHFKELTHDELVSFSEPKGESAIRVRNFMSLAAEIARRSFSSTRKDWAKYDNAWGASWSGLYGRIANIECWIGIDATAWSEHGESPIWLEIEGKEVVPRLEKRLVTLVRDSGYFLRANGNQIAVPLSLGPGSRDEVLERCCGQVAAVASLLAQGA